MFLENISQVGGYVSRQNRYITDHNCVVRRRGLRIVDFIVDFLLRVSKQHEADQNCESNYKIKVYIKFCELRLIDFIGHTEPMEEIIVADFFFFEMLLRMSR